MSQKKYMYAKAKGFLSCKVCSLIYKTNVYQVPTNSWLSFLCSSVMLIGILQKDLFATTPFAPPMNVFFICKSVRFNSGSAPDLKTNV